MESVHKIPLLDHISVQTNPIHIIAPYFFDIHTNITLLSTKILYSVIISTCTMKEVNKIQDHPTFDFLQNEKFVEL